MLGLIYLHSPVWVAVRSLLSTRVLDAQSKLPCHTPAQRLRIGYLCSLFSNSISLPSGPRVSWANRLRPRITQYPLPSLPLSISPVFFELAMCDVP